MQSAIMIFQFLSVVLNVNYLREMGMRTAVDGHVFLLSIQQLLAFLLFCFLSGLLAV